MSAEESGSSKTVKEEDLSDEREKQCRKMYEKGGLQFYLHVTANTCKYCQDLDEGFAFDRAEMTIQSQRDLDELKKMSKDFEMKNLKADLEKQIVMNAALRRSLAEMKEMLKNAIDRIEDVQNFLLDSKLIQ